MMLLQIGFVRPRLFHFRSISVIHGSFGLCDLQHFGMQLWRPLSLRQTPEKTLRAGCRQWLVPGDCVSTLAHVLGNPTMPSMYLFLQRLRLEVVGIGIIEDHSCNLIHV